MNRALFPFLLVIQVSYSNTAIQTDWSGGNGVPGPVNDWANTFHESFFVNPVAEGFIQLGISPDLIEHVPQIETSGALKMVLWGDVDIDGDIDMLEIASDDSIFWHEQLEGPGEWTAHFNTFTGEVISAALIDYGGGTPYWAVDYEYGDYAVVDLYSASGFEFNIGGLGTNQYTNGITAGDVDCDGICDLVGWRWAYDEILVWKPFYAGYSEHLCSPHTPEVVYLFNIDGDDDLDMAIHKSWYPETVLYLYDGEWYPVTLPDFFNGYGFGAGDIDGDGYYEVTSITSGIQKLFSSVNGWGGETLATGIQFCAILDIDGDGDDDVVGFGSGSFHLFYNCDQSGRLYGSVFNTGFSAGMLDHADIDQNGTEDLILASENNGEIRWYEHHTEFFSSGYLDSSILYLGSDPGWGNLDWNAETPEGTSVSFQVRAADDYSVMGEWSDTLSEPCSLQGFLDENDSYFQYRAILSTSNPEVTPTLFDVALSWDPLGLEEHEFTEGLLPISPNPVQGNVTIMFVVEKTSDVRIDVFDMAGRRVDSLEEEGIHEGIHAFTPDILHSGIYICRMISGNITTEERFVVIE